MTFRLTLKRKFILIMLLATLVLIVFQFDKLFYFAQKTRLHKFNSTILSVQKGFVPDIFGDNVPKIWPHRVNSIPRLQYLLDDFNGFECDIYYKPDSNYFDVGHEFDQSICLSLETYFQLPGTTLKYFWLDFKNLDTSNVDSAAGLLTKLDSLYKIKHRVIVESTNPLLLRKIAAKGFFTSYYIPAFDPTIFVDNKLYAEAVKKEIYPEISVVSQSSDNMDRVTSMLPGKIKLSWNFSRLATICDRSSIEKMYNRKDIKVILVEIPTIYYR